MNINEYKKLVHIVSKNEILMRIFDALDAIGLEDYYVGAGAIVQTVWNHQENKGLISGISDIDIVYYDDANLVQEGDIREQLLDQLYDCPLWLDIKNQANVHTWYEDKFGYSIKPYPSLEDALDTWPTTASAIGLRRLDNKWVVYAPFGIEDLMSQVVRANSRQITEEIYDKKVIKWTSKWPNLKIIPWTRETIKFRNKKRVEIWND